MTNEELITALKKFPLCSVIKLVNTGSCQVCTNRPEIQKIYNLAPAGGPMTVVVVIE